MIKLERLPAPEFLTTKYKNWGKRFKEQKDENASAIFSWTQHQGQRINLLLLPILMEMTSMLGEKENAHCSFCDGFPVEPVSANSIEHFKPKSQFPRLAYVWINLFYCCSKCQESKLENFDRKLLKPDVSSYSFEYFFQYNTKTGEIIPNLDRINYDLQRAEKTIELYGLNDHGRPKARQRTIRMFLDSNNPILDEFPYRFILTLLQ